MQLSSEGHPVIFIAISDRNKVVSAFVGFMAQNAKNKSSFDSKDDLFLMLLKSFEEHQLCHQEGTFQCPICDVGFKHKGGTDLVDYINSLEDEETQESLQKLLRQINHILNE